MNWAPKVKNNGQFSRCAFQRTFYQKREKPDGTLSGRFRLNVFNFRSERKTITIWSRIGHRDKTPIQTQTYIIYSSIRWYFCSSHFKKSLRGHVHKHFSSSLFTINDQIHSAYLTLRLPILLWENVSHRICEPNEKKKNLGDPEWGEILSKILRSQCLNTAEWFEFLSLCL